MNRQKTNLIFYISILMVVLVLGSFTFLFKVIQNKNEHANAVMVTLDDKLKKKQSSVEISNKMDDIDNVRKDINDHLLDSDKIDFFVDYLEKLGSANGSELVVTSIKLPDEEHKVSVAVSVKGSFNSVMKTIIYLENSKYQIHFNSIYLNKEIDPVNPQNNTNTKNVKVKTSVPVWQSDIDFSVLSSI